MNPRLVVLTGPQEGLTVHLGKGSFGIGRHASNDLVLRDAAVSRHHATIEAGEAGPLLRDLGSRHGLSVNARSVREHDLVDGDLITLCGSTLLLQLYDSEPLQGEGSVILDDSTRVGNSLVARPLSEVPNPHSEGVLEALREKGRETALKVLLRAGSELGSLGSVRELAEHLLSGTLEAVPAERAALLLASPGEDRFDAVFTRLASGETDAEMSISRTATLRVMHQRLTLLSNDVRKAEGLEDAASLEALSGGSLLCVPLSAIAPAQIGRGEAATRPLGVLFLDDRREGHHFSEDDLGLVTALAGLAGCAFTNLRHLAWVDGDRRRLLSEALDHDLIGESRAMARAIHLISRVAATESTVLIRGESGTGKELAAQAIHRGGPRREKPFVAINCATLSGNLLESELFGHEKGAFTGAVARKLGKLEIAAGGTLFLDEVGELPPELQAKLLRVLQEREFERVGGTRPVSAEVRVIAATNRDLEAAMKEGSFREDLFYRLNVIAISMPPLRDRRSDIPLLVRHFAEVLSARLTRGIPEFSPSAKDLLERYDWPGNVRELANAVERALVLCPEEIIRPEDLPEELSEARSSEALQTGGYHDVLRETKRKVILAAVEKTGGNITEAAKALDLHPNYLHRLIRNLKLRSELS